MSYQEGENSVSRSGGVLRERGHKPPSWRDRSWNSPAGLVAAVKYGDNRAREARSGHWFCGHHPTRSDIPAAGGSLNWGAGPAGRGRSMRRAFGDRVAIQW